MSILKVENLTVNYGAVRALVDMHVEVNEGELVSLCGVNGAGKSTTLRAISGVVKPASGKISFLGEDITGLKSEKIVRKGIALVPEGRDVFPSLTVAENLRLGAYVNYKKATYAEDLAEMHELFPRLQERMNQPAGSLSGGEQQMLAIARGLMSRPKLLMLDEPSLGLSPNMVDTIFELIVNLRDNKGITMLLVEQNAERALAIANRAYLLDTGHLQFSGKPSELKDSIDLASVYFGGEEHQVKEDHGKLGQIEESEVENHE